MGIFSSVRLNIYIRTIPIVEQDHSVSSGILSVGSRLIRACPSRHPLVLESLASVYRHILYPIGDSYLYVGFSFARRMVSFSKSRKVNSTG